MHRPQQQLHADAALQVAEVLMHLRAPCGYLGREQVVVLVAAGERLQAAGVTDPVGLEQPKMLFGDAHAA
jgi:hypothetical protein